MTPQPGSTPVIPGFWSDPTVCRVGDDYYLANSSFEYFPAGPVHHSTDLVGWRQVGNVADRRSQLDLRGAAPSSGVFGATLRHHDGRFWFITTDMATIDQGLLIFTAEHAAGPWSEPVRVPGLHGIDPDLAWDQDGTCYLSWCRFEPGVTRGIWQVRVRPATGQVLTDPVLLWTGTGMRDPEGPHLYPIGDRWYLLIAEGGTGRGHAVSVARSDRPDGPFEPGPANPVLTHRSTDHPVQGVGHGDLVQTPEGAWAIVYHGVRPAGAFPEFHVLGRETFLATVTWDDAGWPTVVEPDLSARVPAPATRRFVDRFREPALAARWVTPAADLSRARVRPEGGVSLTAHGGDSTSSAGALVVRVSDLGWQVRVETETTAEDEVRLLLRLDDTHWYGIETRAGRVRVLGRAGPFTQVFADRETGPGPSASTLWLRAVPGPPGPDPTGGPDEIVLGTAGPTGDVELARIDGRYLSTEVAGGFTGRTVGVQALAGAPVLRAFEYTPTL